MRLLSFVVFSGVCVFTAMLSGMAAGQTWSMSQERYCCKTSGMTLQELASGGVTALSHMLETQENFDEAHRWGIKVLPYISCYKVFDSNQGDPIDDNGLPLSQQPFWKEVDIVAKNHPEWVLIRSDGQPSHPFNDPDYPPYLMESCCNHQSLINAYAQGVRNLMDMGADGVFIDNNHPSTECWGGPTDWNFHSHDWPTKNNAECHRIALDSVAGVVKSYGQDRIVLLNAGTPDSAFTQYASAGDCMMWENFMWRHSYDGQPEGPKDEALRYIPYTFNELLDRVSLTTQSPSVAPFTYLPSVDNQGSYAFYAYSWAKLAGFDQWTGEGWCRDTLRRLYRVDSGDPTSELVQTDSTAYRQFENALIVTNYSSEPVEVQLPVPPSLDASVMELFDMQEMEVVDGQITLTLPAESGRVIVSRADGLDNLLQEIEGQSLAAKLRIEERFANVGRFVALLQPLEEIEADAAALRNAVGETGFPYGADLAMLADMCNKAAGISTPYGSDSFIIERLDNLRNHAALISYTVPEPGTIALLTIGTMGLLTYAAFRRQRPTD